MLSVALVAAAFTVGLAAAPAQADSNLTLAATSQQSALAGEGSTVTLTATNPTLTNQYNLSFSYALPTGVSYTGGSTSPATLGDPQVVTVTDQTIPTVITHQVLVWSNVSDLVAGDAVTLSFAVLADPTLYPVGSSFSGVASAYTQSNARLLPKFDANGAVVAGTFTASDQRSPAATQLSALRVTKSEPSPESELLRGIHDQTTTYTVKVQNTAQAATTGVTVVDYIPAGLEFLGCGGTDNSAAAEYTGAARLTATPTISGCVVPVSVDTIQDPAPGYTGVFTVVTWNLGTLAASGTSVITYRAGIPLHENVLFAPATMPTAASLQQGSNLDNNTGPLTRQVNGGNSYTNTAVAAGTYTGPVAPATSTSVTAQASKTVKAMDLSDVETVSSSAFVAGNTANYDIWLRSGEYTSSSGMTVTATVPNGICPLLPAGTPVIGTLPSDCTATAPVQNATVTSVTVNSNGSFTIVFVPKPTTLAPDGNLHIVYTALMRANYDGTLNAPTASGDGFSNDSSVSGTSTVVTTTGQTPATEPVTNPSSVTQSSAPPTISKRLLPRTAVSTPADCEAKAGSYVDASDPKNLPVGSGFRLGDLMCFELRVNFSTSSDTRNSAISDFVPVGTSYVGYSLGTTADGNTVPSAQVSAADPQTPTWKLGKPGSSGTDLFVTKGSTLVMYVMAQVTDLPTSSAVDITANLMKYSQQNTQNTVLALRAQANYVTAPAPTISLAKGVTAVNGTAVSGSPAPSATVREGDAVDFSVSATNSGTSLLGNNFDEDTIVVWDALPAPITCAAVTLVSASGTCTDNYPGFTGANAGLSAITWIVAGPIVAGASTNPLTYRVTVPTGVSVSSILTNNASVVSFNSPNTGPTETTYYPSASLDTAARASWNTAAANASAAIATPTPSVVKTGISGIVETNNSADQAVPGEKVDYSYSVTVPAGTSVFNGVLADALPAGLDGSGAVATADLLGVTGATAATMPSGYSLDAAGTLTFPATYDNQSGANQVFTVHLTGVLVSPTAATGNAVNTATFTSNATLGAAALTPITATKSIQVVVPTPTITKTVNPTTASAGQTVTYTVTVKNGSTSPAGYDTGIVDCLPAGLTFGAYGTPPSGVSTIAATPGTGSNGCATGTTLLQWTVGTLAVNANLPMTFTATIDPAAAGLVSYSNTATITTSTLNDGSDNSAVEKVITASSTAAVTAVSGAGVTKSVSKPTLTIGDTATYTVTATIPANVNFYDSAIIDTVPSGMTFGTATVSCLYVPSGDCSASLPGGGAALTTAGTKMGWLLGDVLSSTQARTVTVTYTGTVADTAGNKSGSALSNVATMSWNTTNGTDPTSAGATFTKSSASAAAARTAKVTVVEPSLTVGKIVSNAHPEPGSTFAYTLNVTNSSAANTSAAYLITTVDTVPTGVVVSPGTISDSGALTGAGANGGGTITWTTAGPLAVGATQAYTYSATLAASSTLTTAALANSARVTTYSSLPSGGRNYGPTAPAVRNVTPAFPSVTLTKATPNGTTAYAGSSFAWRLTMANATGGGTATTVTATDVLPANWSYDANSAFVSVAGAPATQVEPTLTTSAGVQTLVWSLGPLPAAQSIVINYTATPSLAAISSPGVGTIHPHVNTLSAVTTDATGATASASGSYTGTGTSANAFLGSADLAITKTAVGALVAGRATANAWTITVKNNGPDTAVGPFAVNDTPGALPAGVTVTSASGTGWTCGTPDATTGAFNCTRNDSFTNGQTLPVITVAASVAADVPAGTQVTNSATVVSKTYDPTTPNTSSSTATVTASADLRLVKTVSGAVKAGQAVTWLLAVTNLGPSVSRGPITVTDTLPATVGTVTATGSGWSCSQASTTLTCTMAGDLAVGAAPQIQVSATIAPAFTGPLDNTATVSATTTDPVSGNNTSAVSSAVDSSTTLALAKSLTSGTLVPGMTATYRFDVTNTGLADARTVSLVDALPNGLTYAGTFTSITPGWTCSETGTAPSTVTCTLAGTLLAASGSNSSSVSILVNVPSSLASTVVNSATVSAANAPSVVASTPGIAPVGSADLRITKTHPSGAVNAGDSVVYTLGTSNSGPSDSVGPTTVVDTMPTGMTPTAASGSGWTCGISGQQVSCTRASGIANGQSSPDISVTAAVAASAGPSTLTNTATVSGQPTDPTPGNNVAHDPTVITTSAAVSIRKTGSARVTAGTQTSYSLVVTNAGPSDATAVSVSDLLPSGMTAVGISGTDWVCSVTLFSCTYTGSFAPGSSTITVTASVNPDVAATSTLVNSASVQWVDSSGTTIRTATASSIVDASADLALVKTAVDSSVLAGAQTSFTFVASNIGPSNAVGPVVITDTLPAGMSYVSAAGPWACVPHGANPQIVDCTLAGNAGIALAGSAPTLTMTVQVASSRASGAITNTAVVSSGTTDPSLPNNTSSASTTVGANSDLSITKQYSGVVRIGDPITFGLTVHNGGPSDATGVEVTDQVPIAFSTIDLSSVDPAWNCVAQASTLVSTPVDCTLNGTLANGVTSPAISFTAIVTAGAYPSISNTATVASTTTDTNPSNNSSTVTVPVPPQVSLAVTKTHIGRVIDGQNAKYLVTVTNSGPTEQPGGYWIIDHLPAQLTYVSSSGTGVTCTAAARDVTCMFAKNLATGSSASVTLTLAVNATAGSTIINTASVGTNDEQLDTLSITDSDSAQVGARVLPFTGIAINLAAYGLFVLLTLLLGAGMLLVSRLRRARR